MNLHILGVSGTLEYFTRMHYEYKSYYIYCLENELISIRHAELEPTYSNINTICNGLVNTWKCVVIVE